MSVGTYFEFGVYYFLGKRYAIGISHNTFFFWEHNKGVNHYEISQYGVSEILEYIEKQDRFIKTNLFGKTQFFSFPFLYKFR